MSTRRVFSDVCNPPHRNEDVWEFFHENSKLGAFATGPDDAEVAAAMRSFFRRRPHDGREGIDLSGQRVPLCMPLDAAIAARRSPAAFAPAPIGRELFATMLHLAYGPTRDRTHEGYPYPFRAAPSAGALYPLDVFACVHHVDGIEPGVYYVDPHGPALFAFPDAPQPDVLAQAFVQPDLFGDSCFVVLLAAVFERSVFKYGNRGYRFVLIEAGHVAQNLGLAAAAAGLAAQNFGGYRDREVDRAMGFDGLDTSVVYAVGIGAPRSSP